MTDLQKLIDDAVARFEKLSPEEQAAHRKAQAESWTRSCKQDEQSRKSGD